jgi:hypothetical protein
MKPLGPGRIFWAVCPDSRGEGKKRPMIVATRRTELIRTGKLIAVVCSTDFDYNTLAPDEVELPSDAAGKCSTELKKRTVAVCDWTAEFDVDEIIKQPDDITGIVHTVLLKEICEKAGITLPTER